MADPIPPSNITRCSKCASIRYATIPVVESDTVTISNGVSFSYQINASSIGTILSYGAAFLPTGVNLDASTGLISGTPSGMIAGTGIVPISATNVKGIGYGTLTLNIINPIVFTLAIAAGYVSLGASMLVSVDGGAYVPGVNGTYSALNQFKWKTSNAPSTTYTVEVNQITWIAGSGSLPLLGGSSLSIAATVTASDADLDTNSINSSPTVQAELPYGATGTFNVLQDLTGFDLFTASQNEHRMAGVIASNFVAETILNF